MKHIWIKMILLLGVLCLSACGSSTQSPELVVVDYLNAMITHDADLITTLATSDWELNANLDVDSLTNLDASLNNVECAAVSIENDNAQVKCTGSLDLSYGDEIQSIQLDQFTYSLQKVNGSWLVSGRE